MITLAYIDGIGVLEGEVPAGTLLYVDADWLAEDVAAIPSALVLTQERALVWGARGAPIPPEKDGDSAAAIMLAALAKDAVHAVPGIAGPIEVWGSGLVADLCRLLLPGARPSLGTSANQARPAAIIETTGRPESIASALERLGELGTLVLAGEPAGRRYDVDAYRDLHVRGLHVVGVAAPESFPPHVDKSLVDRALGTLATVEVGTPLEPDGLWFRVSPRPPKDQSS